MFKEPSPSPEVSGLGAESAPKERSGAKVYPTEAGPVEVAWKEFAPDDGSREREPATRAIIFLPGWAVNAESKSIAPLGESFAKYGKEPAYTVSTRAEKHGGEGMIAHEAEAIRQLIEEKGLSEVVIGGHSQGGDKAIDLVHALRERSPQVKVKGLILIDSVGLYEQKKTELAGKFTKDSMIDTTQTVMKNIGTRRSFVRKSVQAATDIVFGIIQEMGKSRTSYANRLLGEIGDMAKVNERIHELEVPVILVHGAEDPISDPKKVAPVESPGEREVYLKEHLFKNSPYVRMVVAEKLGHHGLPLFRSESVAKASLYLLERFHRQEKQKEKAF